MNSRALSRKIQTLEKAKSKDDRTPVKITTCWGDDPVDVPPDVIVIKTVWANVKLDR